MSGVQQRRRPHRSVFSATSIIAVLSCVPDSATAPDAGRIHQTMSHMFGEEEEVFGNIYANGTRDTSSLYYVTLVPDLATASRLHGTFDSLMYQTNDRLWAYGWFDPADTDTDQCGNLTSYLDEQTSDAARDNEVHASAPGFIGSGTEAHCIRPGRYRISLWKDGIAQPLEALEIDYLQTPTSVFDTTPGATSSSLLVENTHYDPQEDGLADNTVHFDLSAGLFTDTAVLQIDTARADVTTKEFRNDPSPSGLHTDWFRFGAQRSTSNWNLANAAGRTAIQGRLFYDYIGQSALHSGYYNTYPSASGAPVLRVFRYQGRLLGDTSATLTVGLETKRPDEPSTTVADAVRQIEVIVGSPPPDTAINTFVMPSGVLESANTWLSTDQYLDPSEAETGPNRTYSWRFDQGSWIPGGSGVHDFSGFTSSGSRAITLRVYNSSIDSSHYYIGGVNVVDSTMYLSGPQSIPVKTSYSYGSSRPSTWAERDSFPEDWRSMLEPATTTYNRVWAAGEYTMDLRAEDDGGGVLRRSRVQVTVCTVSQSCGGGGGSSRIAAGASVIDNDEEVLFGAGPVISWGGSLAPSAVRYYELTGRHDGATAFRDRWWIEQRSGVERTGFQGGTVAWRVTNQKAANVRVVDFTVTPPADESYTFGVSLDPDLGRNAADDQARYDPKLGMIYVMDENKAVGYLLRDQTDNALASAIQYGVHRPPPVSIAEVWTAQRNTGVHLLEGRMDVQLIISARESNRAATYRLFMIEAENPDSLRAAAESMLLNR